MALDKIIYTAHATATGGRDGRPGPAAARPRRPRLAGHREDEADLERLGLGRQRAGPCERRGKGEPGDGQGSEGRALLH